MPIARRAGIGRRPFMLGSALSASALSSCGTVPTAAAITKPTRFSDRPMVMAIGDSLYQGVRSLSFTAALAQHSPPAQVARALGATMAIPDPPRPILYDLEALLQRGALVDIAVSLRQDCIDNSRAWLTPGAWSASEAFDNVAIGGAEISSLYTDTFASQWPTVQAMAARVAQNPLPDLAAIGQLWFALNTCFTLNPQRRDEQAQKTQVDQVRDRRPRLLLVNIGSNEGLYRAAFLGAFDATTLNSVAAIPDKMAPLADQLASLPPEVEVIAFNSLIRPRTASNLMPGPRANRQGIYPGAGYFSSYGPWIISQEGTIPAATIQNFDQLIADVNARARVLLSGKLGSRLRFVDLYAASDALDGKHYRDRAMAVRAPNGVNLELRNIPLTRQGVGRYDFTGGLTGLDNMHPTVPGYAAFADAVLASVGSATRIDKNAAFAADTLLNDIPFFLPVAQLELRKLGQFGVFKGLSESRPA